MEWTFSQILRLYCDIMLRGFKTRDTKKNKEGIPNI